MVFARVSRTQSPYRSTSSHPRIIALLTCICQCRDRLGAGRIVTRYAKTTPDIVADDDRWAAADRRDVPLHKLDILTHGVGIGRACKSRDVPAVL
jgi:hypothetical protein